MHKSNKSIRAPFVTLYENGVTSFKAGDYDHAFNAFRLTLSSDALYSKQSTPFQPRKTLLSMKKLKTDIMDLKITNHRFIRKYANKTASNRMYFRFDEGFNNLRDMLNMDELCHIDASAIYYNMGKTKERARDYIDALTFYFDAIQGAEKKFSCNPDDHVVLVSALRSIGTIYYLFGDFAASLSSYSLALHVNKEGYDYKDNLVTASILCCIGILKYHLHCENGVKLDAIDLEESLVIMKVLVNEDHIDIATVKNNLGQCYAKQGKIDLALRILQEALEVRRKEYGEDHQDVAAAYYNIGDAQQIFPMEALGYYSRFIKIARSKGIWYYPDVARVLHTAGDLYGRRGNNGSMISYYSKAFDIEQKLYGDLHESVLRTLNKLGTSYMEVKYYQAAKVTFRRLLNKQIKVYGTSNVIVLPVLIHIAKACRELKENDLSLVTYESVLHIQKHVLQNTKAKDIFETLTNLGFLHKQKGDLPKALSQYREAFELSEVNGEAIEYAKVIFVLHKIVDILKEMKLEELRADYTLKLINTATDDMFDLHNLSAVALIYKRCHKYEKALGCYQQIFSKQARRLNYDAVFMINDHDIWNYTEIIGTIYNIGEMHLTLKNRDAALHQFLEAIKWLQRINQDGYSFEDDDTFEDDLMKQIADFYLQAGSENRASQMYEDASIIFRAAGLNDAKISALIDNLFIENNSSDPSAPAA